MSRLRRSLRRERRLQCSGPRTSGGRTGHCVGLVAGLRGQRTKRFRSLPSCPKDRSDWCRRRRGLQRWRLTGSNSLALRSLNAELALLPKSRSTTFLVLHINAGILGDIISKAILGGSGDPPPTCFPDATHREQGRCTSQLRCARLQLMHAEAT